MIVNNFSKNWFFVALGGTIVVVCLVVLCFYWNSNIGSAEPQRDCLQLSADAVNSTLELVHIVFRHGPRTPVDTYPNDPYKKDPFHPTGWGHVTNKGKYQLFEIGKWLKSRYSNFLQPFYSPNLIYAQATASPRALMSLSTVLASMLPPKYTPMDWNSKFNWQPVPIFSEPLEQDTFLLVRTPCPRYFEARDEVLNLPEVKAELHSHAELLANLTNITGMPILTADDVNSLFITLEAEKEFGLSLPTWTKEYFPHKMRFLAEKSYIYNTYTPELQKIKGGPFLKKMFSEMKNKQANKLQPQDRKLFIYTGHDWTVGNILSALKVWKLQMPQFSIMTIFELHRRSTTDEYFVKIFLRNGEQDCPNQLEVPDCGVECPLDKLIALSADVLPNESLKERCEAKNQDYVAPPPRPVDQAQLQ